MSNVALSVTVFHVVAAVTSFGLMVVSAIKFVQDSRDSGE
jgi:hypothetical protein